MGRRNSAFPQLPFPLVDQRPGFFTGIVFAVLLVLGVLFWYLLFAMQTPDAEKILKIGIASNVITLVLSILIARRADYERFSQCFGVSYFLNLVLSVVGLYLFQVQLFANSDGSQMIAFWRFVLFVLIAALMNLLPTIVICAVMWIIMSIFCS